MSETRTITIPDSIAAPTRVDKCLADLWPDLSRSQIARAIDAGGLTVDGAPGCKARDKVRAGARVELSIAPPELPESVIPEDILLDIVHEDDHVLVINKPPGMVVHPAAGNWTGTLVNALAGRGLFAPDGATMRPGIVHRLDKGTSGLLVVAKTESAHVVLAAQLKDRTLSRTYLAVAWGHLPDDQGTIDAPIGRSSSDRKKMAVTRNKSAREAVTHYRLLTRFEPADLVELKLETGRTHQIRVHLTHIGHPVVGDSDYGGDKRRLKGVTPELRDLAKRMLKRTVRPLLHAQALAFVHPGSDERVEFAVDPPPDFRNVIKLLETEAPWG